MVGVKRTGSEGIEGILRRVGRGGEGIEFSY